MTPDGTSIDEASRLHLYEQARSTWGADAADTLMNAIPNDPSRLATADDVALVRSDLRTETAALRADLRTETAALRADLRTETAALRAEIYQLSASSTRTIVLAMIASNATLVGLVLAAARLG